MFIYLKKERILIRVVFFLKKNKKFEIEKNFNVNIGDSLIFYSTLIHSVEKVKIDRKLLKNTNENYSGRWWAGFIHLRVIILKIEN